MNKNIEVEGGEIAIRNSHGDLAIIPKDKRNWVKQKLVEGCHGCIDSLVETLPVASQYAQDGSVYPPNKKVKINQDNQIKEYDISSPEYRDLYNSGKLMSYDKTTDSYIATPLKEVTITAEAPQWLKYKRDYEKTNPKSNYINSYLTPFAKSLGNTETNYPKRLDEEYEQKSLDYVSEQLVKNKPQGKLSRVEWLNQMFDKEEELVKRNPKYQSSLWADTKRGLTSLVEQNPIQTFQNILSSSDYTNREKQEMLKDYADHPIMSKLGDAAKILNPLTIPSKTVQSIYKDGYSFTDALKGKKNNAGLVEDIVTDPLNLVGAGLVGKLSKADKVIDATKAGSKVLNKLDDAVNNINRIKFDDFKNDNEFFRVIVGDEAFDDIVQTQKIRTKKPSSVENTPPNTINLDRRGSTAFPSFSKGSPSLSYANDNPNHYIIRTADESIKPSTSGRHGKGTTMFPTDKSGKHLTELDASKVQVYKHVGNGEYELVNTAKPIVSSVDDVVKNLPKLEQIPLDFKIEDVLKNISSTERKNMEIIKKGNAYFKELDNPESLKRLKEFGDEYNIDLLDAYKEAEKRWDYGTTIDKHERFQVKKTDKDWYGLSTTKWDYEDKLALFTLKEKFGEDSKQVKDFYKKLSQEKSINYISDVVPLDRYEKTIWHELSHDINKSIIDQSPKLQEDIKNIFIEKGTADLNKVKKGREYAAEDFYTKKDKVLKDLDDTEKLKEIGKKEFDYITRPTETWAFLSTNLRQDLKNTGVIKNYNELLTPEKLEQAIKNGNTVFSRFEPYIKDKEAFIKLFNKMTLSIAPAALYLQSQNQNKLGQ